MQIPKEEVRQAILRAAEQEILQEGYKNCSMRRIAAGAGVSPGNIYAYFSGKKEILDCILRPAIARIRQLLATELDTTPPSGATLRQVNEQLAEIFASCRRPFLIIAFRAEGTAYEGVIQEISREIAGRVYRELLPVFPPEMRKPLLADMLGEALLHGLLRMFKSPPEDEKELKSILESFLELMCGMKAQERGTQA